MQNPGGPLKVDLDYFLSKGQWTYGPTLCLSIDTHILQCIFSAAPNIPSSPRSVLHCRYPETTLNPHSTSMGGGRTIGPLF